MNALILASLLCTAPPDDTAAMIARAREVLARLERGNEPERQWTDPGRYRRVTTGRWTLYGTTEHPRSVWVSYFRLQQPWLQQMYPAVLDNPNVTAADLAALAADARNGQAWYTWIERANGGPSAVTARPRGNGRWVQRCGARGCTWVWVGQ